MWCEPWVWDWNLPKLHFFGAQVIFFLGARKMSDFLHRRCAGLNLVVRIQQLVVQLLSIVRMSPKCGYGRNHVRQNVPPKVSRRGLDTCAQTG